MCAANGGGAHTMLVGSIALTGLPANSEGVLHLHTHIHRIHPMSAIQQTLDCCAWI
jgi:hypothetical protein